MSTARRHESAEDLTVDTGAGTRTGASLGGFTEEEDVKVWVFGSAHVGAAGVVTTNYAKSTLGVGFDTLTSERRIPSKNTTDLRAVSYTAHHANYNRLQNLDAIEHKVVGI